MRNLVKLVLCTIVLCTAGITSSAQVRVTSNPSLVAMSSDGYLRGGTVKVSFAEPVFAYQRTVLSIALNRSDLKFSVRDENKPQVFVNGDTLNWLSVDVSADHMDIDLRLVDYGVQSVTIKGFVVYAGDSTDPSPMVPVTLSLSDGLTMDLPSALLFKVRVVKDVR